MWRRCRPPCTQKLLFSFKAKEIVLFRGPVYVAYVPGTDLVVVGGETLVSPQKPRGSGDSDKRWASWAAVTRKSSTSMLEWWVSETPATALPRPHKRLGAFMYGTRKAYIQYAPLEGEPVVEYAALPEVIRKFWRSTVAKLFRFTDGLYLSNTETQQVAEYSRMWAPFCWSFFSFQEQPNYPPPPSNFLNKLLDLARSCRTETLPITAQNLTLINCYTNQLFARISHRYGFLNLSTNHILTFALAEKIVSTRWSGSCADVELEESDIRQAMRYWAKHNLHYYTVSLRVSPVLPERNLHLHHIAQQLGVTQWYSRMQDSLVLSEDQKFLERQGSIDPNYIKVPLGTQFIIKTAFVPVLPLVPKNNRVCSFFYSVIQNDSFFAHFPLSVEPLPCIVSFAGATYALSALINLSIGRLQENFPINVQ